MKATEKKTQEHHAEPLPEHLLEHATETHIHDPNADRTALEIWIRSRIDRGPAAWGPWVGGVLVVILGAAFLSQASGGGKSGEQAWTKLLTATSADEYIDIANAANSGSAAAWASYMAAQQYYTQAIASLLVNRETADLNLNKAKTAYEKALDRARQNKDDELANTAELGLARTLEMQGKLTEAIELYDKIAKAATGTSIGDKAAACAALLRKPEATTFYQALATYKPQPVTAPPGFGNLGLPLDHPPLDGPAVNTPLPSGLPNPGDMLRDLAPPPAGAPLAPTLPGDALKDLAPPPATTPAAPTGEALKDLAPPPASKPAEPAATPAAPK